MVRVEKPDEADQIGKLKKQIAELQRALGQTQAENVLNQEYLKLACERLGEEIDGFKKSSMARRPRGRQASRECGVFMPGRGDDATELL